MEKEQVVRRLIEKEQVERYGTIRYGMAQCISKKRVARYGTLRYGTAH